MCALRLFEKMLREIYPKMLQNCSLRTFPRNYEGMKGVAEIFFRATPLDPMGTPLISKNTQFTYVIRLGKNKQWRTLGG